jgi:hypothetical protein
MAGDRLIGDIVRASRIASPRRRQEVRRELAAHVEDFTLAARQAGRSEDEIERMLAAQFGDPEQIASGFAWVYRRERMLLQLAAFPISTVVVTVVVASAVLAMQAALGSLSSRHTLTETLDILATVAVYVGLLSLEKWFERRPIVSALAVAAACSAILFAVFAATGMPRQFLLFGFLNAAWLRSVQACFRYPAARLGAACAGFGVLGALFFHPSATAIAQTAVSWLLMAGGYQAMTRLAARVDGALLNRFQRL